MTLLPEAYNFVLSAAICSRPTNSGPLCVGIGAMSLLRKLTLCSGRQGDGNHQRRIRNQCNLFKWGLPSSEPTD